MARGTLASLGRSRFTRMIYTIMLLMIVMVISVIITITIRIIMMKMRIIKMMLMMMIVVKPAEWHTTVPSVLPATSSREGAGTHTRAG